MELDPSIVISECPDVYPPSEDTFLLLRALEVEEGEMVLEMGCGSGILSIHCARRGGKVTAVDVNPMAVECARRNANANSSSMDVIRSDLFDEVEGRFDLIFFNLPYLPVEEVGMLEKAWSGGSDGLSPLNRFLEEAPAHLRPGGRIVVLLSSKMDQAGLERLLRPFESKELGRASFFFERLWVMELRPPQYGGSSALPKQ
jgi:release factor glutamine methyltransferase